MISKGIIQLAAGALIVFGLQACGGATAESIRQRNVRTHEATLDYLESTFQTNDRKMERKINDLKTDQKKLRDVGSENTKDLGKEIPSSIATLQDRIDKLQLERIRLQDIHKSRTDSLGNAWKSYDAVLDKLFNEADANTRRMEELTGEK